MPIAAYTCRLHDTYAVTVFANLLEISDLVSVANDEPVCTGRPGQHVDVIIAEHLIDRLDAVRGS